MRPQATLNSSICASSDTKRQNGTCDIQHQDNRQHHSVDDPFKVLKPLFFYFYIILNKLNKDLMVNLLELTSIMRFGRDSRNSLSLQFVKFVYQRN